MTGDYVGADSDAQLAVHLVSTSLASDGSFVAMSEIGALLAGERYRLIGGVAVVLHQHVLNLEHPVRATADADFGIVPYVLKDDSLVQAIAELGYERTAGNRWERRIDAARTASVDLLVPGYTSRHRSSVQHGSTNTTEVGGLAEAMKRPPVRVRGDVLMTDGRVLQLDVMLPDRASLLGLKLHARRVRKEDRDAADLWTCLELLAAGGDAAEFARADFDEVRGQLLVEFGEGGDSMRVVTANISSAESERRRVRLRALVQSVIG